jgi:protein-S-isoprenylcysteine O-methyltransferase Ste14
MKRAVARYLGTTAFRGYRLIYNFISVVTFIPVLAVPALFPGNRIYQFSGPVLIIALTGQVLAVLILIVGLFQTGASNFIGIRQILSSGNNSDEKLLVEGLYRWVRHPLYSAGLLFIWQRRLMQEFGIAYEQYQLEVPRLLPRIFSLTRTP